MASLSDETTLPVPCPKCAHECEQSLVMLDDKSMLLCPSCGMRFPVKREGVTKLMAEHFGDMDVGWVEIE